MVLESHSDWHSSVSICPNCHQEYENGGEHICPNRYGSAGPQAITYSAPPMVAPAASRRPAKDDEILEETLDMRFHIEKPEDPHIGKIIADRYCIKSLVGRGGMGMVYKAEQMNIERLVAIKMLHPHIVADAETIRRFHKEAQAVSRVDHPHSVRIYDFGITPEAQPYLVMDFIDGVSLRQTLKKDGPLSLSLAGEIFAQVVEALSCAHSVGVIHRDMKPENIMLCERGGHDHWVYVVDFGISKLASNDQRALDDPHQGERRGSPPYMSPEQCTKHAEVGCQSDIYSLAVVIYESLSGRLPYNARNTIEMLEAHISGTPIPLTQANPALASCEALAHVLMRSMEKNPEKRQQSIDEFGAELAEAVKRDKIRLNYLKNRKESILTSQANLPALEPPAASDASASSGVENPVRDGSTPYLGVPIFQNLQSGAHKKLINSVIGAITGNEEQEEQEVAPSKYIFINCPHCNEPVEKDIAFCLACGRSLATTQEFAKVRAATGVFTLPRSQDTLSSSVPVFSPKTRQSENRAGWIQKGLWAASVVLIIAIIWLATAGGSADRGTTHGGHHAEGEP